MIISDSHLTPYVALRERFAEATVTYKKVGVEFGEGRRSRYNLFIQGVSYGLAKSYYC